MAVFEEAIAVLLSSTFLYQLINQSEKMIRLGDFILAALFLLFLVVAIALSSSSSGQFYSERSRQKSSSRSYFDL